jgi:NTE family protein
MPTTFPPDASPNLEIGLVLSGGGARGAYEAGAMSVLLPLLTKRGERPGLVLGTSIGALNAGHMIATAHLPVRVSLDRLIRVWHDVQLSDIIGPLVSPISAWRMMSYVGGLLGIPNARVPALLDTTPLRGLLNRIIDFEQIHYNTDKELGALAVVATSYSTGESMVFHEGPTGVSVESDVKRGIRYIPTRIDASHVQSSASIPLAFKGTYISSPADMDGWYGDGGTRLNTPTKPTLKLGAKKVVIIGLNSSAPPNSSDPGMPDIFDGAGQALQALFADPLAQDVGTLASANREVMMRDDDGDGIPDEAHMLIPYIFVAPRDRLTVGKLAEEIFCKHFRGIGAALRARDLVMMGSFLGAGSSPTRGELFSMLFFATEFHNALIDLGRADAERWLTLTHDDGPWRYGDPPLPDPKPAPVPLRRTKKVAATATTATTAAKKTSATKVGAGT